MADYKFLNKPRRKIPFKSVEDLIKIKGLIIGERAMIAKVDDDGNLVEPITGIFKLFKNDKDVMGLDKYAALLPPMESDYGKKQPQMSCTNSAYMFYLLSLDQLDVFSEAEIIPKLREDPVYSYYAPLFE